MDGSGCLTEMLLEGKMDERFGVTISRRQHPGAGGGVRTLR
jgi:hypothetical protein